MSRIRLLATALTVAACFYPAGSPVLAQDAPAAPRSPPEVTEMAALFHAFCLLAFPNDTALDEMARGNHLQPLSRQETAHYLHADPGRGWRFRTQFATYVLTIEQPPYNACALRRMTGVGFPTAQPFLASVRAYVAARPPARLVPVPTMHARTPGGADIIGASLGLTYPAMGRPSEMFMHILTNYHFRYAGEGARDVPPGTPGVEVRYVHQMLSSPDQRPTPPSPGPAQPAAP